MESTTADVKTILGRLSTRVPRHCATDYSQRGPGSPMLRGRASRSDTSPEDRCAEPRWYPGFVQWYFVEKVTERRSVINSMSHCNHHKLSDECQMSVARWSESSRPERSQAQQHRAERPVWSTATCVATITRFYSCTTAVLSCVGSGVFIPWTQYRLARPSSYWRGGNHVSSIIWFVVNVADALMI